jgi:hypothetical protein
MSCWSGWWMPCKKRQAQLRPPPAARRAVHWPLSTSQYWCRLPPALPMVATRCEAAAITCSSCCHWGAQELEQRRSLQLLQLSEGVRESRQCIEELEQRLAAIRNRTAEVRQHNLERQARLRDAGQQVRGCWGPALAH